MNTNSYDNEAELIKKFVSGNNEEKENVFMVIVNKYQEKIYWQIRRMLVNHEDTNDTVQNVFIKVWKNLQDFNEQSKLYTWIYRIAINESLNFIKQKKRRPLTALDLRKSNDSGDDEVFDFSNEVKAEENFDTKKAEWKLQLAIQTLPKQQKLVFNLRYFEELPYEEIEKILGTSESALKTNYHLAVKKIESILKEDKSY